MFLLIDTISAIDVCVLFGLCVGLGVGGRGERVIIDKLIPFPRRH